jgi:hypothetical protein
MDCATEPGFSEFVVCESALWHLRRRARHCGYLAHEHAHRVAAFDLPPVDGRRSTFFPSDTTGRRSRRCG